MFENYFQNVGPLSIDYDLKQENQLQIFSIVQQNRIKLTKINQGIQKIQQHSDLESRFTAISVCPITNQIAIGHSDKKVYLCKNADSFQQKQLLYEAFFGQIYSLQFSKDGQYLAISSYQQHGILINMQSKKAVKCRPGHSSSLLSIRINNDSTMVFTTGNDGQLRIYSLADIGKNNIQPRLKWYYKISKQIKQFGDNKLRCAWSPDNLTIAIAGKNILNLFTADNSQKKEIKQIKHQDCISICQYYNNNILATFGLDSKLILWNMISLSAVYIISIGIVLKKIVSKQNFIVISDKSGQMYLLKNNLYEKLRSFEVLKKQSKQAQEIQEEQSIPYYLRGYQNNNQQQVEKEQKIIEEEISPKLHKKIERFIDVQPQQICYSGQTQMGIRGHRYVLWNYVGIITSVKLEKKYDVKVEFADKSNLKSIGFHRNFILTSQNIKCVALNYSGVAVVRNLENQQGGIAFYFKSFVKKEVQWGISQKKNEIIECVAIGNQYVYVATDCNNIYVYQSSGLQILSFTQNKPIIALSAYQNLLVIIYHDSPPLFGCQNIKFKIFILDGFKIRLQTQSMVSISPYSILKWIGFSEQGLLISQDSNWVIRAFLRESIWVPIYLGMKKYWLISMCEYKLQVIQLQQQQKQPLFVPRPSIRQVQIEIPSISNQQLCIQEENHLTFGKVNIFKRFCG